MTARTWQDDLKTLGLRPEQVLSVIDGEPPKSRAPAGGDRMNKTEARYAHELELLQRAGVVLWWAFGSMKIRLANRTWYTPDFAILDSVGLRFVEIKGFLRDDAAVKFKVARETYQQFKFTMLRWVNGAWQEFLA